MAYLRAAPGDSRATGVMMLTVNQRNPKLPVRFLEDSEMEAVGHGIQYKSRRRSTLWDRYTALAGAYAYHGYRELVKHITNRTKKPGICPDFPSETACKKVDELFDRGVRFQKSHCAHRGKPETWECDERGNHLVDWAVER